VSSTPRDLLEDPHLDNTISSVKKYLEESSKARRQWQRNRVNPLPKTMTQLKKARKIKRLQEAGNKAATERSQRLQEIGVAVIRNLSKE